MRHSLSYLVTTFISSEFSELGSSILLVYHETEKQHLYYNTFNINFNIRAMMLTTESYYQMSLN